MVHWAGRKPEVGQCVVILKHNYLDFLNNETYWKIYRHAWNFRSTKLL